MRANEFLRISLPPTTARTVAAGLVNEGSVGRFGRFPLVGLGDPVHVWLFPCHLLHEGLSEHTREKEALQF